MPNLTTFKYFPFIFFMVVLTYADNFTFVLPDSLENLVLKTTTQTMKLDYKGALKTAAEISKKNSSVGCVIESIVRVSIYDDLGDTSSLKLADKILEKCKTQGLWNALKMFELGFVKNEQGQSIKGALKTRSAAKLFENSKELDSKAFYAIYAYYVDQSFSWIPFKSDHREEYLAILDSASTYSKRFWPLFITPLIWMYYDKEDYNKGLELSQKALKKAPQHPVMLQIKADMLYRLKRFDEAASIYEKSAESYIKRSGKSIRYWCSVLNLIRIYNDKGDLSKASLWREKLNDPEYKSLKNWMPESLLSDLKKRNLL